LSLAIKKLIIVGFDFYETAYVESNRNENKLRQVANSFHNIKKQREYFIKKYSKMNIIKSPYLNKMRTIS
jgi:hypothetical protein